MEINSHEVKLLKSGIEKDAGTVYLIGTDHTCRECCQKVEELIAKVKPHIVMIELCQTRDNFENNINLWEKIRKIGLFPAMISFCMEYRETFTMNTRKVNFGHEMIIAQYLSKKFYYKIILGDRPIEITLKRIAGSLGYFKNIFISFCVVGAFFGLKNALLTTAMDIIQQDENYNHVLVHERDVYLTNSLQIAINEKFEQPTRVIGIVGEHHVRGIMNFWGKITDKDVLEILKTE